MPFSEIVRHVKWTSRLEEVLRPVDDDDGR
jgi:hypothetical protein